MPVGSRRGRFVVGAAALAVAMLLFAATALAFHGSPPKPAYVTELGVVPGSGADPAGTGFGPIASGDDATWVAGTTASGYELVRIGATDPVEFTRFPIGPNPVEHITITSTAAWASATQLGLNREAQLYRFDPANPPATAPTRVYGASNAQFHDIATGPDGNVWFSEQQTFGQPGLGTFKIGKLDAATVPPPAPTYYPLPAAPNNPTEVYSLATAPPPDATGLWFIEKVGGVVKLARLETAGMTAGTITKEFTLGQDVPADELTAGPGGLLWFLETLPSGETSITSADPSSADGAFVRHGLGGTVTFGLAATADALWFGGSFSGNVGRLVPGNPVDLLCIGPGHPARIAAGPGANVTFTEFEEQIGRIPANATGAPCPKPTFPSGGGGGAPKKAAKDTVAPKISLSGKTKQRFTRKGTLTISVQCNEACVVTAQAAVSTPGASKVRRSKKATKLISAGKRAKLTLRFKKKDAKAIVRALKRKRKLKAKVAIGSKDSEGNASSAKRTIKLKR
jgi:streptogramin lyase